MTAEAIDAQKRLIAALPRLRRFSYVLLGDMRHADRLVEAAIARITGKWSANGSALDDELEWLKVATDIFLVEFADWMLDTPRRTKHAAGNGRGEDERASLIRRAMLALPSRQRATMALVCIEGLSYADAATVMGMPTEALVTSLAATRKALAEDAEQLDERFGIDQTTPPIECIEQADANLKLAMPS